MEHSELSFDSDFEVITGNSRAQAAVMVLEAGETTGGPDNRHRGSDQWMHVVGGEGTAVVAGRNCRLRAGTVLLIERGEPHEIRNTGGEPLRTLNIHVPPACDPSGDPLPSGQP